MLQVSGIPVNLDRLSLDEALQEVLVQNKEEFVLLFLEIGANLKTFLNKHRLQELYNKVNKGACFLQSLRRP